LVDLLEYMMMHGLTKPKFKIHFSAIHIGHLTTFQDTYSIFRETKMPF